MEEEEVNLKDDVKKKNFKRNNFQKYKRADDCYQSGSL